MIPVTQSKGYLVGYEHSFALQHDSCLKTVAKPVYVSKAMLVIKPDASAVTWLTALHCRSSTVTLVWIFLLFDSGWNQKYYKLDLHNVHQMMHFITRILHLLE